MIAAGPLGSGPVPSPGALAPGDGTKGLREAAQGVEAMFLRQLLAAARAGSLAGEDDVFGSSSETTFAEMRDARFAEIAAQSGAIGLAQTLAQSLAQKG